ncbi:MAG: hypothetical protein HC923_09255, partial [Myxococcales bacterium]|nr:hypothetical protein [Myxococcales bacterium]
TRFSISRCPSGGRSSGATSGSGANSTLAAGVTIGDQAIIGANSFVNRDISPAAIAHGAPARRAEEFEGRNVGDLFLELLDLRVAQSTERRTLACRGPRDPGPRLSNPRVSDVFGERDGHLELVLVAEQVVAPQPRERQVRMGRDEPRLLGEGRKARRPQ